MAGKDFITRVTSTARSRLTPTLANVPMDMTLCRIWKDYLQGRGALVTNAPLTKEDLENITIERAAFKIIFKSADGLESDVERVMLRYLDEGLGDDPVARYLAIVAINAKKDAEPDFPTEISSSMKPKQFAQMVMSAVAKALVDYMGQATDQSLQDLEVAVTDFTHRVVDDRLFQHRETLQQWAQLVADQCITRVVNVPLTTQEVYKADLDPEAVKRLFSGTADVENSLVPTMENFLTQGLEAGSIERYVAISAINDLEPGIITPRDLTGFNEDMLMVPVADQVQAVLQHRLQEYANALSAETAVRQSGSKPGFRAYILNERRTQTENER